MLEFIAEQSSAQIIRTLFNNNYFLSDLVYIVQNISKKMTF